MRPVVERLRVVGREASPESPAGAQPDLHPGLGPLSGIHAALATAAVDRVLVVACDFPLVTTVVSSRSASRRFRRIATRSCPVPAASPSRSAPLYRVACLGEAVASARAAGARGPDFARSLRARFLDDCDLERLDPSGLCLLNVNTPLDYRKRREILRNESKT